MADETKPIGDRIADALEHIRLRWDELAAGLRQHDENQRTFAEAIQTLDQAIGGITEMLREHHAALMRAGLLTKPARRKQDVLN